MTPRWARCALGTEAKILTRNPVEVLTEPRQVDAGSAAEDGDGGIGRYEPMSPQRSQLAYRHTVPGDDEGLTLVQCPHDRAAIVPELPLRDYWHNEAIVAHSATSSRTAVCIEGNPGATRTVLRAR